MVPWIIAGVLTAGAMIAIDLYVKHREDKGAGRRVG